MPRSFTRQRTTWRDFQEYLKSAEAGDAVPSLRVRRTPQPADRQEKPLRLKRASA